jgi:hypothetical protein
MIAEIFLIVASVAGEQCPNYEEKDKCEAKANEDYLHCIGDCDDDTSCLSGCSRLYNDQLTSCPCNENCPDGCPCPIYECSPVQPSSVLILNTYLSSSTPILTDLNGRADQADFVYEEQTAVEDSCSVVFNGHAYIYGGSTERRQVSVIDNSRLKRLASLDFDFSWGACTATTDSIYLCFHQYDARTCRMGHSPTGAFDLISHSNVDHKSIQVSASHCE